MKYIILIAIITNIIYGYNSKEINNFYNNYYSSKNHDINSLKVNNSQTYKNIYNLITSKNISLIYNSSKETIFHKWKESVKFYRLFSN